ncbi:MAG: hypothetical protein IJ418_12330 [Clostridia bacterium]|nr:hypothetical protein [Clostridia bacterium]
MDTSILSALFMIAPDLMQEIELRTLVLERVAALEPIGRRALAQRLQLPEREVRSAADALRASGCITLSAAGMELTDYGCSLVDTARAVSRGRRSLSSMELTLAHKLDVERVCVVRGDADTDEGVLLEAAQAAARQIRFLLQDAQVLAVSGGRTMRMTAEAISLAAPMDVTVVPAQGGMGGAMDIQANVLAEIFARNLGGEHRLLHLPEGISAQAAQELCAIAQIRETMELLRHADVLLYGISHAQELSRERGFGAVEREALDKTGAIAEALGFYFNAQGAMVSNRSAIALRAADLGRRTKTAAVAVGARKAEAIVSVCMHHPHKLLVTDEGAALRIMELLRV